MSKLIKGKILGIAIACLLVASLVGAGILPAPTLALNAPSVSIVPEAQEVEAGGTFDIDVWVDAAGHNLNGIDVAVQYDSNAMTTSVADIEAHNDLLGPEAMVPPGYPKVTDGEVRYALASATAVGGVDGSVMTITFTMDAGAGPGDYPLTISRADLADLITGIWEDTETNDGAVTIPGAPAGPSVSIDPEAQDVVAGNTFTIDVLVDADGNDLMGIDVKIGYDADAMTTSPDDITAYNLLEAPVWGVIGPIVPDGTVRYTLLNVEAQAGVDGVLMTIEFAVNEAAEPGDYNLTITVADLVDEAELKIPGVAENDGTVTVLPAGPVVFDQIFGPKALVKGARDFICTIPAEATELEISLTATADHDLELYDGATLVVGYRGNISRAPGGTYEGDAFGYSGYRGGAEYITAGGPLGQAYDLKVYAYRAGTYTVHVHYEVGAGVDLTPPTIDIEVTVAALNVGYPITVTVSATDPNGVAMVYFMVSSTWPEGLSVEMAAPQVAYDDIVGVVVSFGDGASLTFIPGWVGTYTVDAWATDELGNMTPEGSPVTATFEVVD